MRNVIQALPSRRLAALLPILGALLFAAPANAQDFKAYAQEVLRLVNEERARTGAPGLVRAPELDRAAQKHSQDMADAGYFNHYSQDGRSPWDRIRTEGYNFSYAGENIAYGYSTPQAVMTAWMNSPGHRTNIMNPSFSEIGIGVAVRTGTGGLIYWTQDFGTRPGGPPPPPPPSGDGPPRPALASLTPASARVGETVALTGTGFGESGTVLFSSNLSARIVSWKADRVEVEVPAGAASGDVFLQNTAGTSNGLRFDVLPPLPPPPPPDNSTAPRIDAIDPPAARPGQMVTITGRNFSWFRGGVSFNGGQAGRYYGWSPERISVVIPADANSGPVTVSTDLGTSLGFTFTVTR